MSDSLVIELSNYGCVIALNDRGGELSGSARGDMLDCTRSGDVEPACQYILEAYEIDWRIVKTVDGEYQNVTADADDKRKICEQIYFESDSDFSDEETSEMYLIWEAASNIEGQ